MSIDCTNYEDCPKERTITRTLNSDRDCLEFAFLGCWGVYCKGGVSLQTKWKDGKFKEDEKVVYGQKYVLELLQNYSKSVGTLDALILAGDNVYSDYPSEERRKKIKAGEVPDGLYDIEKQIDEGFLKCFRQVEATDYLVGIGNHDIENCYILNKEINNPSWTMPAISFNIIYRLKYFSVNLIFIDTNMYENKWCKDKYPDGSIERQERWISSVLEDSKCKWNIMIGHIPFMCNGHKEKAVLRREKDLEKTIRKFSDKIDAYLCADEHNQQYIKFEHGDEYNLVPEIVCGSGGAILDENIQEPKELKERTLFAEAKFGFVGIKINTSFFDFTFYSRDNSETFFILPKKFEEFSDYEDEQFDLSQRMDSQRMDSQRMDSSQTVKEFSDYEDEQFDPSQRMDSQKDSSQTVKELSLPSELVRRTFEILFDEEPLNLFNFDISIYAKHYTKNEFSKLIIKCLKRDCKLHKKKHFLDPYEIKSRYILYNKKEFISILRLVQESDYSEFLSIFCGKEFPLHTKPEYNLEIVKLIISFDINNEIEISPLFIGAIFDESFDILTWLSSIVSIFPWDKKYLTNKGKKLRSGLFQWVFETLIKENKLKAIEWCLEQNPPFHFTDKSAILTTAIVSDNVKLLDLLYTKNFFTKELLYKHYIEAVSSGSIEMLKWYDEKIKKENIIVNPEVVLTKLVMHDNLKNLLWLYETQNNFVIDLKLLKVFSLYNGSDSKIAKWMKDK
jgi:hypothetical protein